MKIYNNSLLISKSYPKVIFVVLHYEEKYKGYVVKPYNDHLRHPLSKKSINNRTIFTPKHIEKNYNIKLPLNRLLKDL